MTKNEAGFKMYMSGLSQVYISKILKVSENTISTWSKKHKWREKKVSEELKHENSRERILKFIDYTTEVMDRLVDKWKDEDPESLQLLDKGHIDALKKLYSCIPDNVKHFSDYVTVMSVYMDWLEKYDLDLAKQQTEINTEFLDEMRKKL